MGGQKPRKWKPRNAGTRCMLKFISIQAIRLNLFTQTALASYKAEDVRPKTEESSLLHSSSSQTTQRLRNENDDVRKFNNHHF